MGIWHGNSWKYMVGEGWYFWFVIVTGQLLEPFFKKQKKFFHIDDGNAFWRMFQISRTFLLAAIGMIPFRANSLEQAIYMARKLFVPARIRQPLLNLYVSTWTQMGGKLVFLIMAVFVMMQIVCDFRIYHGKDIQKLIIERPLPVRWILYFALIFAIILAGTFGQSSFIYFGF